MNAQNPFPAPATPDGYQTIAGTCSEGATLRLVTGNLMLTVSIVNVDTLAGPLALNLYYNAQASVSGPMGTKWRHTYLAALTIVDSSHVTFTDASGSSYDFIADSHGDWHLSSSSLFFDGQLSTDDTGIWQLTMPNGDSNFFTSDGVLMQVTEAHIQSLMLAYSDGMLSTITEPGGRQITLGYTGTQLTSIEDPNGNTTTLTFDDDGNLTQVVSPAGCVLSYGYATPANGLVTSRTDALSHTYSFSYDGSLRLTGVTDAETESHSLSYSYDTVNEHLADETSTSSFARTTLVDARSQTWEYRFDSGGNLWRLIDPLGHMTRCYYDENTQTPLYVSQGYALVQAEDGLLGPRDHPFNAVTRTVTNRQGNIVQALDASGVLTQWTYDSSGELVTAVFPGQAHTGIQGNWPGTLGQSGYLLCAWNADASDLSSLPAFVSSVTPTGVTKTGLTTAQVLMDPAVPIAPSGPKRGAGFWEPTSGESFTLAIHLSEAQSFNLSLYSHSADLAGVSTTPFETAEVTGRDITFTVSDALGIQTFRMYNDVTGVWATFPVQGNATTPILVTVAASGPNTSAHLAAMAFDPYDNHVTRSLYTPVGDLMATIDPLGNRTTYQTNLNGTLAAVLDANQHVTAFFYDGYGNIIEVRDAMATPGYTFFTHDQNGNVLSMQNPNGHVWHYQYDGKNRLVQSTDPLNFSTLYAYDDAGNLESVTDANGHVTTMTYTPTNRLYQLTDAAGDVTTFTYDPAGAVSQITDARGNSVQFAYDNAGKLLSVTRPDTSILSQAYDVLNRLVAVTSPNGNLSTVSDMVLLGAGNQAQNPGMEVADPYGSGMPQHWTASTAGSEQDTSVAHSGVASLKLAVTSSPSYASQMPVALPPGVQSLLRFWATTDASSGETVSAGVRMRSLNAAVNEADSATTSVTSEGGWTQTPGLLFQVPGDAQFATGPVDEMRLYGAGTSGSHVWLDDVQLYNLSQSLQYDNQGRMVGAMLPDGTQTQLQRDRWGRVVATVDGLGNVTRMAYDGKNQVLSITDALGHTTTFGYDPVGNLSHTTDANGNETSYSYDNDNRLVTITYPDATAEIFSYDLAGNLVTYTDNLTHSRSMTYDVTERLAQVTYTDATTVQYGYDAVGNLVFRKDRNGDLSYLGYDAVNRLTVVERALDGHLSPGSMWLQHNTFDANGNRTQFCNGVATSPPVFDTALFDTADFAQPVTQWSVPDGGYDSMNRLVAFEDAESNETTLSYDIESRLSTVNFPNGVETQATYDILGRLMTLNSTLEDTSILGLSYCYDANSNRIGQRTETDTFDYRLDAAGQLIGEAINRMVERGLDRFMYGTVSGVSMASGALTLLPLADTFSGSVMNADVWRLAYAPGAYLGLEVRQNNGLNFTFPRSFANLMQDYLPPVYADFGLAPLGVWAGAQNRNLFLSGNFDVQVDFANFQATGSGATTVGTMYDVSEYDEQAYDQTATAIGLKIHDTPLELAMAAPQNTIDFMRDTTPGYRTLIFSGGSPVLDTSTSTSDVSGSLRVQRSGDVVNVYTTAGGETPVATYTGFTTNDLYVSLVFQNNSMVSAGSFTNFQVTVPSAAYPESGTYTSAVYNAVRTVTLSQIAWQATTPSGTAVGFQVAAAASASGPFDFVGPDGTSATFFTSSGASISDVSGQYLAYQATLTGSGSATPTLSRVDLLFSGTNTSTLLTYSYDAAGNMIGKITQTPTDAGTVVTETRTVNSLNQITANSVVTVTTSPSATTTVDWTFEYDANGNLHTQSDGTNTTTYTWDQDNRLTNVLLPDSSSVSYTYDMTSRLLSRTDSAGTTTFVWDGPNCVQETDHAGNVTRYYSPRGRLLSFDRTVSSTITTYQVQWDILGSATRVTDSTGTVQAVYAYDAWGNQLAATSDSIPNGGLAYRFVGALGVRLDTTTGLYYMRARWYDPGLARFLARDAVWAKNRYYYSLNCPTNYVDASGLCPVRHIIIHIDSSDLNEFNTALGTNFTAQEIADNFQRALSNGPGMSHISVTTSSQYVPWWQDPTSQMMNDTDWNINLWLTHTTLIARDGKSEVYGNSQRFRVRVSSTVCLKYLKASILAYLSKHPFVQKGDIAQEMRNTIMNVILHELIHGIINTAEMATGDGYGTIFNSDVNNNRPANFQSVLTTIDPTILALISKTLQSNFNYSVPRNQ